MTEIIALRDLQGSYRGRVVLGPLSLDLRPGEIVALVGRSGAGKSTLLSLLHERLAPDCALLPQDLGLVASLSAFHNAYMGRLDRYPWWTNLRNLIRPQSTRVAEVGAVLQSLALAEKLWQPVANLSGGEKQRVGIARAIYQGQRFLVADEPVSALDILLAKQALAALIHQYDSAVIALHDVDLALSCADRIIGLHSGQLVLDQPAAQTSRAQILALY